MRLTRLALGPLAANCYVLCCEDSDRALVIDPGADEPALREALTGLRVPKAVVTHGHWDHVSGVPYLQREFGTELVCHHAERECLKRWAAERGLAVKLGDFVGEGDLIEVGSVRLKVLHLPGHSPGPLVLMEDARRWLFTGDLLVKGGTGGANVAGGDPEAFVASINRLRTLDGDWTVYPGHHGQTSMAEERAHNPYVRFRVKQAKAVDPGAPDPGAP